jgi:hypothetical protein
MLTSCKQCHPMLRFNSLRNHYSKSSAGIVIQVPPIGPTVHHEHQNRNPLNALRMTGNPIAILAC